VLRKLIFVVDARGWVQERRLYYLNRYLTNIKLFPMSVSRFLILWNRGQLRDEYIYFATWRIPSGASQAGHCSFQDYDFDRFMTSVTSHYNIGGGLNPDTAVAVGRDHNETFETALLWLNKFKIVTANSNVLYDLLSKNVPRLLYVPNGVDNELFKPKRDRAYNPSKIRIGWVGKQKAAKNYQLIEAIQENLNERCIELKTISVDRSGYKNKLLSGVYSRLRSIRPSDSMVASSEFFDRWANSINSKVSYERMPLFYQNIDYYLNTSWHEGTPNPALEAASCGVPVITTKVGNMPDLISDGDNGFFIKPTVKSLDHLLDKITKLSVVEYNQLSKSARDAIVIGWRWEAQITNYQKALNNLLEPDI
jgi:glycosyltransferase involved in cell wall biosynthesis